MSCDSQVFDDSQFDIDSSLDGTPGHAPPPVAMPTPNPIILPMVTFVELALGANDVMPPPPEPVLGANETLRAANHRLASDRSVNASRSPPGPGLGRVWDRGGAVLEGRVRSRRRSHSSCRSEELGAEEE